MYGGYLAEMDNSEEMTFIRNFLKGLTGKLHGEAILIGGSDEGHEGTWKSTDNNLTMAYFEFGSGYPYNADPYNCLYLLPGLDWKMTDYPCITNYGNPRFLCEMSNIER